ncbi:MAG: sugar kinase [Endomicrobia bacterium]|nr:sugar kinase [Endomicrobiia bacterium]
MRIKRAIIVRSKTRLETLLERFNTKMQAKFYIEKQGADFSDYECEHETFYDSLNLIQRNISAAVKYKIIDREFLPHFIFSDDNIILAVGQDGLVANTAKYSKNVPIVAVNPDKKRYDGVLLPFDKNDFLQGVQSAVKNDYRKVKTVGFAQAALNDGQKLLAFNDLFIGVFSHISARYKLSFGNLTEEQSSSGIIISTQAGSTGWLSSVFNMANGVSALLSNKCVNKSLAMSDNQLVFAVREPFVSIKTRADLVAGVLNSGQKLVIESLMPSNGVIFSDGIEKDFLNFNSGSIAEISLSCEKAYLITK